MKQPTTLEFLETRRAAAAEKLRVVAPALMAEFEAWDAAIRDIATANQSEKYLKHKEAINAIVDVLQEAGKPLHPNDIVRDVLAGGWLKWDSRRRLNVYDSLMAHVRNRTWGKLKLFDIKERMSANFLKKYDPRKDDYLVGLREWSDDKHLP